MIDFQTHPFNYQHWRLSLEPPIAYLHLDVNEDGALMGDYALKLNSYDLGVDIELADIVQRLRFEHPGVKCVIVSSAKDNVFCAGANIKMLSQTTHAHKVNFCKFTNETRLAIEDASDYSGQTYICALNGPTAGGGYELALCTDHIMLTDDGNSSVSLPEVPLLGVLPGTGGLTRLVDKRGVRRDLADVFCTTEEGVKGQKALEWNLIDELVAKSQFDETVRQRALQKAALSDRPDDNDSEAIALAELDRAIEDNQLRYTWLDVIFHRDAHLAEIVIKAPSEAPATTASELVGQADKSWVLACARQLDDALLHLRFNEPELSVWTFSCKGDIDQVVAHTDALMNLRSHWLAREIALLWKRTLKRIDLSSRTTFALIDQSSCFAGLLSEISLSCDRSYMFDSDGEQPHLVINSSCLTSMPMGNGLSRLQTRFFNKPEMLMLIEQACDRKLTAQDALALGLVTDIYDDIDWDDEIRITLEQRASFSGDSLTGMEANLRFPGPETMETKIFARLSAWQNWIFQRPSAAGENGALRRYGSGKRPEFDTERV